MRLSTKVSIDRWVSGSLLLLLKPLVMLLGRMLRRDHRLRVGRSVLVIKLVGGGSLFIALPNLLGLKRRHPDAELVLLATPAVRPFAEAMNVFDRIEVIDDSSLPRLARSALGCWWRLLGVDTVVDLEVHSVSTTLFALATFARNRLAFYLHDDGHKRHIATHLLFLQQFSGIYWFYDEIFGLLGAVPVPAAEVRRQLLPDATAEESGQSTIRLALGHACSDLGKEREFPPDAWAALLARKFTADEKFSVTLIGGAGNAPSAEKVAAALRRRFPHAEVVNACGCYSIAQVVRLIEGMDAFWGIDSALLHIARAIGKPNVSFWGPTDPATRLRDLDPARDEVHYLKVPCSPCVHVASRSPCRGNQSCMTRLLDSLVAEVSP